MSNPNANLYQTSNGSTSTLRPRNTRLISYLGDESEPTSSSAISTSAYKSTPLFNDRGPSPSASRSRQHDKTNSASGSAANSRKASIEATRAPNNDIWTSWSSIASSLLGGDPSASKGKGAAGPPNPKWMKQDKTYSPSTATRSWGPKIENPLEVATGLSEDRQALLQAKKREALLLGGAEQTKDASGRYKRRDSDSNIHAGQTPDADPNALVYVHKIQREDTLAGVMLKYGCQQDVFRKVNRFWPNDNIQVRNHVFLPVEACSVRGKKVSGPHSGPDLLGAAIEDLAKTTAPGKGALKRMDTHTPAPETQSPMSEPFPAYNNDNPDLRHDSWVSLPQFTEPVAILRIPRSSLGYFPRARRKSPSRTLYTDDPLTTTTSKTSTPRSSFDTLRHPPSHAAQMSLNNSVSHSQNASPVRRPTIDSRQRSNSSATAHHKQTSFMDALRGPGGVGNLRGLRTEPSRPGPSDDPLNRKFAQYFPELAIVGKEPGSQNNSGLMPPPLPGSFRSTPRASIDSQRSGRSNSSGLGDLAGNVEGWMRKMASGGSGKAGGKRGVAAGPGGMADLIELETTSDAGGGPEEEDALHTPTMPPAPVRMPSTGLPSVQGTGTARDQERERERTEEEELNERFPVRGRIRSAYEKDR
jgi:hypothetical protein